MLLNITGKENKNVICESKKIVVFHLWMAFAIQKCSVEKLEYKNVLVILACFFSDSPDYSMVSDIYCIIAKDL